ncbi:MAG: hypothetical protein IT379_04240 [Deltaproteobacteria bacterium]|nr:hypothetical protein [Deltaproteobacteria bacterium]
MSRRAVGRWWRTAIALVLLTGCGARSELYDDERPRAEDAGPRPFATFPCRWSLGRETVARELDLEPSSLVAGVRGGRAEVLILADGRGAVLTVADPPVRVREVDIFAVSQVLTAPDAWVVVHRLDATACALHLLDGDATSVRSEVTLGLGHFCTVTSRRAGALDVTAVSDSAAHLIEVHVRGETFEMAEPIDVVTGPIRRAVASSDATAGWVLATTTHDGAVGLRRVAGDGTVESRLGGLGAGDVFAAPDRLRSGLAVLRVEEPGRGVVERAPLAGPLAVERVADVPGPLAPGESPIASNETEALVSLRDGRVMAAALNGLEPSLIGPVTDAAEVHHVVVALETGTSVGGVAYTYRERRDGPVRVAFRALTCNR